MRQGGNTEVTSSGNFTGDYICFYLFDSSESLKQPEIIAFLDIFISIPGYQSK